MESNVIEKGEVVTQIICFENGEKKTIKYVKTETISQSEFTRFDTVDGKRFLINTKKVNWIEIIV